MPLQRRVPKFGFKNINRVEYKAINLEVLEALATAKNLSKITVADLREAGLVPKKSLVKILGNGAITKAIEVEADAFSKKAEEAIAAAGGSVVKK
jgi:large subunit ribosomal protein L15